MKRLIVDEVQSFRSEVRAQARAAGQIRRQDRSVLSLVSSPVSFTILCIKLPSLPIPTRDEILNSPTAEPAKYTSNQGPPSPIMDDPSSELERELAGTHIAARA